MICLNAHGKKIDDAKCDLPTKPREVDECTGDMCTYKWVRSNWTNVRVATHTQSSKYEKLYSIFISVYSVLWNAAMEFGQEQ